MIAPYKDPPAPVKVALLTVDERELPLLLDTRGRALEAADTAKGWRVYSSLETVSTLLARDQGEALCWNGEPVRYRLERLEDGWRPHPSDVRILRVAFPESIPRALAGLKRWRDWLAAYGAVPGSLGQASYSLLRATLEGPLWTSIGEAPPITFTVGGRQQLTAAQGEHRGRVEHVDLPAAYGSTLGELHYGGRWHRLKPADAAHWGSTGYPCFLRARVHVPKSIRFGPLVRRPRKRRSAWQTAHALLGSPRREYPTGATVQGVWTREELDAARAAGCSIRELEAWLHVPQPRHDGLGLWQPFLPWWRAVEEGRRLPGFARLLAKATGNALWGQFAMTEGSRAILTLEGRGRNRLRVLKAASRNGQGRPAAHDLTETVCGRVRAQLATMMLWAGESLLCAHTDGGWTLDAPDEPPAGWRVKDRAEWIRLVSPLIYSYQPVRASSPVYVFSGIPYLRAPAAFEDHWRMLHGEAPDAP